ncbi:DUF262 domain-containing protein [Kutzneria sp. NPDC052558]|uniref:DUF262 domain-containing protein n=1 Tax=Kutzneria sp. NPDC052558 TaxID=3364121 RepID=UPI0037C5D2D6
MTTEDEDLKETPNNSNEVVDEAEELANSVGNLEPISYFGTDFDVHGLVRRLNLGEVIVPNFDPEPESESDLSGFQRKFVWKKLQMDRFIESLLLGFPVPGIFLVQQSDKKLLVLDGQQRLRTLQRFYREQVSSEVSFKLETVGDQFKGLTYTTLEDDQRRTLDNTFIHATIIKYNPDLGGDESVYSLFERLNTGGTNLYPQEIRVALYHGALVELLRELNSDPNWRSMFGPPSDRLKDQEIILRFLALWKEGDVYKRPLKTFLNAFLARHRNLEGLDREQLAQMFRSVCEVANSSMGRSALRAGIQVNAAFADAILVGLAARLTEGDIRDHPAIRAAREALIDDPEFQSAIARATADEERVSRRLNLARAALRNVQ